MALTIVKLSLCRLQLFAVKLDFANHFTQPQGCFEEHPYKHFTIQMYRLPPLNSFQYVQIKLFYKKGMGIQTPTAQVPMFSANDL